MPQRGSIIKSDLRRRVILHSGAEDLVFYEGKLAEEFGVSRTPIRQVLQALASESLVEVRSGVGTIAPPLLPERHVQDLTAFSAILTACSACPQQSGFSTVAIELATLRMHLEAAGNLAPDDLFFDAANRFVDSLGALVDDKILKDTLVACFWRYIRRRVVEQRGDIPAVIQELIKTVKDAEYGAQTGQPEQVFRMVAANVDVMIKLPSGS